MFVYIYIYIYVFLTSIDLLVYKNCRALNKTNFRGEPEFVIHNGLYLKGMEMEREREEAERRSGRNAA